MLKINDRKLSIINHSILVIGIIVLMTVASFFDLKISQAMSRPNSVFAQLFITLGEFPAYMTLPVVGTILFYAEWNVKKNYAILIKCAFAIVTFVGYLVWGLFGEVACSSKGVLIIYSMLLTLGSLFVGKLMDRQLATRLVKWCLFAVCVVASTYIIISILKEGWGRVRYRDLVASGSTEAFTPWYLAQGFGGVNKSFPSGHAASACNLFAYVILFEYSKKYNRYRYFAYALCILFTLLTSLSRIVVNAHYLSDVVMGSSIAYGVYYLYKKIFFKNNKFAFETLRKTAEVKIIVEQND